MSIADVTLLDLLEHELSERERAWAEFSRYWTACERALERYRKRVGAHWKTADEILFRAAWAEAELARRQCGSQAQRARSETRPVRQAMTNEHFRALVHRRDELQSEHETACAILEEEGSDRSGVLRCMGVYAELTALQQQIDDELEAERHADAGEQGGSA